MGLKLGFETGELLDFYKGCSSLWNSPALLVHLSPPQLHKHLHDFQALLDKFPLLDPKDETKDEIKDDLRVKFKIICTSLGISKKRLVYKGNPNPSANLDF
ncbi:hypothetical protein N665_1347s0017 [Sinapis alba]|nr:hypothetical protein N665_1347s0017 [Sinapis alba]